MGHLRIAGMIISAALLGVILLPFSPQARPDSKQSNYKQKYVEVEELVAALNDNDITKIEELRNVMLMHLRSHRKELLFLRDLWRRDQKKYPDISWKNVNSPNIRLEIADILVQASKSSILDLDENEKKDIHDYVLEYIGNKNPDIIRRVVMILSTIDDKNDVEKVYAIAKEQRGFPYYSAVLSLVRMCSEEASAALLRLEEIVTNKEKRSYIRTTKRSFEDRKNNWNWCDQEKF